MEEKKVKLIKRCTQGALVILSGIFMLLSVVSSYEVILIKFRVDANVNRPITALIIGAVLIAVGSFWLGRNLPAKNLFRRND
jgi:hypothetical protein